MNLGISANGVPSSVTINASRTNRNRAFVDNQSTFVVGEGSNLHVGTVENTGAVIGKEGNSTFKIDTYVGKDIQNYDTMTTTGGSIGASLGGKPKITNVGFNQDSRDKQGITRNTVVGDVEIAEAEGSPINRDLGKANEVTKDTHRSTNINVESQTIEYLTNPGKLKEDIGKAKEEINDIKWAIKESIHDRGDDNRNFFGQLSEVRLDKSLENITSERLIGKTVDTEIAGIFKAAYKDLGYDINIIFSDPKNSPQLLDEKGKPKTGTAYVRDEKGKKIKTIIINGEDPKNATKAGLIGTIVEEGSHVIGKVEGRQRKTGTDEKGLESTGRASNEYFSEKYKDDNPTISIQSDGKDYSNVDFGEHVGDDRGACTDGKKTNIGCKGRKQKTWSELTPEEKSVEGEIVSTILNFVPYVGPAKIATEAIIGKDLITNKKMSYLDRVSSVLLQSKFHLGELNPKKIGTKKTKEPHKEKPLRRKEKVGNDRKSVKAKTSENKSSKDIELVEGKDGIFEVPKNEGKKKSNTSVSKSNPVTKKEPMRDVTPKVKESSTKGTPKSPAVKPVTKVEQNTETVKQPAVTSEKTKTVEKSHSQGSNNHNSNKESFNQKTEKNSNRNLAGENYGTEKTSNKMPPFSNRENIHRNSNTQNYDYKVQDNSTSNGSSNGDSGSKKNIEPSVENSGKIYTLESQDANWNFKSEIPKTAVKNSEGNYTLGRNNEWNFDTKYNIPYTETGNKGQGLVSVPSYEALMNDYSRNYDIFHHSVGEVTTKPLLTSNYETYYRTISQEHYDILKNTGKMPAGYNGETFISPSSLYVQKYDYGGVTLEFKLNPGTTNELMNIGVKNRGGGIMLDSNYNYSKLPNAPKGWGNNHAMFKLETTIQKKPIIKDPYNVNIGLGREGGKALNIFNDNIIDYKVIGE